MTDTFAYKILREAEATLFDKKGLFTGSPVDVQDGFIHLSLAGQIQGTLDKHYTDGSELRLIEVELAACTGEVKFEVSRDGAKFPHLFGILYKDATRRVWPLRADTSGRYALPSDLPKILEA